MLASKRDACLFCPIMSFKYQTPKNNASGNVSNGLNKGHSSGSVQPYHVGAGLHIHIVWETTQASHVTKDREVGGEAAHCLSCRARHLQNNPYGLFVPKSRPKLVFNHSVFLFQQWMDAFTRKHVYTSHFRFLHLIFVTFSCASNSKKKIPICKINFWN